jgi:hypothetical protein
MKNPGDAAHGARPFLVLSGQVIHPCIDRSGRGEEERIATTGSARALSLADIRVDVVRRRNSR